MESVTSKVENQITCLFFVVLAVFNGEFWRPLFTFVKGFCRSKVEKKILCPLIENCITVFIMFSLVLWSIPLFFGFFVS